MQRKQQLNAFKRLGLPLSLLGLTVAATITLSTAPVALARDKTMDQPMTNPSDPSMQQGSPHHMLHRGDKSWKEEHKAKMDAFLTSIGVTADQKKQLDAIRMDAHAQAEPIRTSLFQQKRKLVEYVAQPDATETVARTHMQTIDQLQQQMADIQLKSMFRAKSVLTPEQQQKLAAHLSEEMQKHEQRGMGQHGDGAPGPDEMQPDQPGMPPNTPDGMQ